MQISETGGKIIGMLMAYFVSFLGLLLAYYNYKKRRGSPHNSDKLDADGG